MSLTTVLKGLVRDIDIEVSDIEVSDIEVEVTTLLASSTLSMRRWWIGSQCCWLMSGCGPVRA